MQYNIHKNYIFINNLFIFLTHLKTLEEYKEILHQAKKHREVILFYSNSWRLINAKDYGIKVGSQAEVTVIDAKSPAEAVATNAPVLAVFKRGRQTVSRPRAELMRP